MIEPTKSELDAARKTLAKFLCLSPDCVNRALGGLSECSCVRRVAELLAEQREKT